MSNFHQHSNLHEPQQIVLMNSCENYFLVFRFFERIFKLFPLLVFQDVPGVPKAQVPLSMASLRALTTGTTGTTGATGTARGDTDGTRHKLPPKSMPMMKCNSEEDATICNDMQRLGIIRHSHTQHVWFTHLTSFHIIELCSCIITLLMSWCLKTRSVAVSVWDPWLGRLVNFRWPPGGLWGAVRWLESAALDTEQGVCQVHISSRQSGLIWIEWFNNGLIWFIELMGQQRHFAVTPG